MRPPTIMPKLWGFFENILALCCLSSTCSASCRPGPPEGQWFSHCNQQCWGPALCYHCQLGQQGQHWPLWPEDTFFLHWSDCAWAYKNPSGSWQSPAKSPQLPPLAEHLLPSLPCRGYTNWVKLWQTLHSSNLCIFQWHIAQNDNLSSCYNAEEMGAMTHM
jgi:hypothetical protein